MRLWWLCPCISSQSTRSNSRPTRLMVFNFCLSVAIAKNERLVFAKSYGLADKDSGAPVTISSRFRIMSISKTIAATLSMWMHQRKWLDITDKVFGTGSLTGAKYLPPRQCQPLAPPNHSSRPFGTPGRLGRKRRAVREASDPDTSTCHQNDHRSCLSGLGTRHSVAVLQLRLSDPRPAYCRSVPQLV